jgi:CRISPR system Cascade subunit CasD
MTNPLLLVLRLEGPMQSWGLRARWDVRDTGNEPSKSGIIGMLGCALGYKRNDKRLEEELDANLVVGIREERPGVMSQDFHTVMGSFLNAKGETVAKTIVSPRAYIQDASFLVIIGARSKVQEALLHKCREALDNPRWPIFLGRKSCPPTRPVIEDLTTQHASIEVALREIPWSNGAATGLRPKRLRCVMEDPGAKAQRPDAIRVNATRIYGTRNVSEFSVDFPSSTSRGDTP